MRKYIFGFDILVGLALLIVFVIHFGGCTASQQKALNDALTNPTGIVQSTCKTVETVAPALAPVATSLGWPVWGILIINVLSSAAGAVVASTKKSSTL